MLAELSMGGNKVKCCSGMAEFATQADVWLSSRFQRFQTIINNIPSC